MELMLLLLQPIWNRLYQNRMKRDNQQTCYLDARDKNEQKPDPVLLK